MGEVGIPPALVDAVQSIKDSISAGRTDIFRKLLEACETCDGGGVEERIQLINSFATEDGTFLHMATKLGRGDILRALLAADADPGVQDQAGNTPLQVSPSPSITAIFTEDLLRATAQSDIGRVCQLVAGGLSVNAYDNPLSKNTPLHWAASFADLDTLNCLIARGADVDAANSDGATPLHDAVARGDAVIVKALLEHGALINLQCHKGRHKGKTVQDLARKQPSLLEIIEKFSIDHCSRSGRINGGVNRSISPVMARRSVSSRELNYSRGMMGSYESLASIGADSVMTNGVISPNNDGVNPSDMIHKTPPPHPHPPHPPQVNGGIPQARQFRSPINSTSSLELSPRMEQVCERLAASQITTPPRPLVTHAALHMLWPQPRRIIELNGTNWVPPAKAFLGISTGPIPVHEIVNVWDVHKCWLREAGCEVCLGGVMGPRDVTTATSQQTFTCVVDPSLTSTAMEYTITIKESGVRIVCGSLGSLHNALVTVVQILRVFRGGGGDGDGDPTNCHLDSDGVPPLVIMDGPSLGSRGFMLDVAPLARIPTFERLCQVIDSLLSLKINQLHLLLRISTTAVSNGSTCGVSPTSLCPLPYTPSELVSLERYCCDRGITLVPAFDIEAAAIPTVLTTVYTCIASVLTHFSEARLVHLGPGLTSLLSESSLSDNDPGITLNPWARLYIPSRATLMVCANVFHNNATALARLPPTAILVEYGFQADYDFSDGASVAMNDGRPLFMCPGTAAWSSLSGWPEAGVSNVYSGAVSGIEAGASGMIVAHWSSTASLTPLVFAWPPLIVAAGLAWNHNTHWDYVHSSVGSLIDTHLVRVPSCGLGTSLVELGRCETWLTRVARGQGTNDPTNLPSSGPGSTLYQLLADPDSVCVDNLGPEVFATVMRHVRRAVRESTSSSSGSLNLTTMRPSPWPLMSMAILELHLALDMILTSCRLGRALVTVGTNPRSNMGMAVVNPGVANLPPTLRTDLANKVLALREVYSSVWLQGLQAPGLHASLLVLTSLLARLLPEQTLHAV